MAFVVTAAFKDLKTVRVVLAGAIVTLIIMAALFPGGGRARPVDGKSEEVAT